MNRFAEFEDADRSKLLAASEEIASLTGLSVEAADQVALRTVLAYLAD